MMLVFLNISSLFKSSILYFLILTFATIHSLNAKTIIIERKGPLKCSCFNKIEELHSEPWVGKAKHKLIGCDEGNTKLEWMHPPKVLGEKEIYDIEIFIHAIDNFIYELITNSNKLFLKKKLNINGVKISFLVKKITLNEWYRKIIIIDKE